MYSKNILKLKNCNLYWAYYWRNLCFFDHNCCYYCGLFYALSMLSMSFLSENEKYLEYTV